MATKEYIDVALVYDFDGTLSPGNMQEFGFVQAIGKDSEAFWTKTNELAMKNDADGILCYMYLMMEEARANNVSLRRESFVKFGSKIKLFKGVEQWFEMINKYGKTLGLNIKHYVNSSGLKEMIEGTSIAKNFERIYACSFLYNVDDVAYWPAVAVNYTTKTQFLFKINKGIKEVSDNTIINKYLAQEDRPMPFERMIYFGDGDTDIPSMKVVKEHGGHAIAVYGKRQKRSTAMRLIKEGRVNFACTADYSEGKDIHNVVKTILQKIRVDYDFQKLLDNYQEEAGKEVSL